MDDKEFLIEELRQRYNQYRWLDETRTKYIQFYFIYAGVFWGVANYLKVVEDSLATLIFAISGTFFSVAIISFRRIQKLESDTIRDIKKSSKSLRKFKYVTDRHLPWIKSQFYSTTSLVFLIVIINLLSFFITAYKSYATNNTLFWINYLIVSIYMVFLWVFRYKWKPRRRKLK